ncbi:MAG: putative serine protease HhoA precursor [Betaproteobacteria bacterium ADurb.Bin341]|nr:MAG: putative serine protease HhoA precursor [Betaproteobacteria bacterium ADurb.Bin341]
MSRIFHAISFAVITASSMSAHALTPTEVFSKASPSVWGIKSYDNDGLPLSLGSAVVIAPETLITNCHVLRKAARITLTFENISIGGTLEMWDTVRDLCQIRAKNLTSPPVKQGSSSNLQVGQSVYTIGNPKGLELTLGAGLISSLRKNNKSQLELIQTSAPISPGSSGGGLFDDQGRLIGITTLQIKDGQNLNFAIPVEWIKELPVRHHAARTKEQDQINLAEQAKKSGKPTNLRAWNYQYQDIYNKNISIVIKSGFEGRDTIVEEASVDAKSEGSIRWTTHSTIVANRSAEGTEWVDISPFLFTGDQHKIAQNLSNVPLFGEKFHIKVRALGEEEVSVPAGNFKTVKYELIGRNISPVPSGCILCGVNSQRSFELRAWYSKELGRIVKLTFVSNDNTNSVKSKYEINLLGKPDPVP